MTPSETLVAAADLIRDAGKHATPGPWGFSWPAEGGEIAQPFDHGGRRALLVDMDAAPEMATVHWVCLMSPDKAPLIENMLRQASHAYLAWVRGVGPVTSTDTAALALAKSILGSGVDTHG